MVLLSSRQTAVLGLCGRLSAREEGRGDSCMDCTTVCKERAARPLAHPKPILMGTGSAKTALPNQRTDRFSLCFLLSTDCEFSDNSPMNPWLFTEVTGNVCR